MMSTIIIGLLVIWIGVLFSSPFVMGIGVGAIVTSASCLEWRK